MSLFVLPSIALLAGSATPSEPMTLDNLPNLPRAVTLRQFASTNKHGVNGDADWFLYKDEKGDAVIVDMVGPGCLRSFWRTDVSGAVYKFYFDGDKEPRFALTDVDLFSGKTPKFPPPLTSLKVTGTWSGDQVSGNCFMPMPFAKSLKISVQGHVGFYHFLCEQYPFGTEVKTFTGKEDNSYLIDAFKNQGDELQPHPDVDVVSTKSVGLAAGERLDILTSDKPGTVTRLVVEGDATEDFLNQVELEMRWDEALCPNVITPIGMFFGCAVRPTNVRALPFKVEVLPAGRMRLTSYFRMPFWRHGFITIVNRQQKATGPISAQVHVLSQTYKEAETGYFNAMYRDGRTEMGRDWLIAESIGTGQFVGVVQSMFGSHYCEGDEHFTVDGAAMPQVNGTGTEDYFLGCYWPNKNFNFPFAGCVGNITEIPGPSCYYRLHLEAPLPFYNSLDARIQHGGNSDIVSHYRTLGFYYARKRPVLRQTDLIDVANNGSELAHKYTAKGSKLTGEIESSYPGNSATVLVRDEGREHVGGEISFVVAVDPKNDGVRLRRRIDQKSVRQSAEVFVDGQPAGTWYHAEENPWLRWFDSEFELPADLTHGKKSLTIKLKVNKDKGFGAFTDYRYEVLTYVR